MRAYLDHASTSLLRPAARDAMVTWLGAADPGRVHTEGLASRAALEEARSAVASFFGTRSRQVIFTSGATEAINAAAYGALTDRPGAAAVAGVEHSAVVLSSSRWASSVGAIRVSSSGGLDLSSLASVLASGSVSLVQCQYANHEVGTLQPVSEVVSLAHSHGAMVHVDAAAAAGHVPIDFDALGADLMSVSAHKMGGPAGIGALLVRRGLRITPFILGGAQERARRGGLENVAAAAGFGAACATIDLASEAARSESLVGRLRSGLLSVPGVVAYGGPPALPNLVCVGIEGVEAEPVLIGLDRAGVAAHSGSSCSSEDLAPSPVLSAMGVEADRSLRLSVGWSTTDAEVDLALDVFPGIVAGLRGLRA